MKEKAENSIRTALLLSSLIAEVIIGSPIACQAKLFKFSKRREHDLKDTAFQVPKLCIRLRIKGEVDGNMMT